MTPTEFKDYLMAFLVFAFRLTVILAAAALIGGIFLSFADAAVECRSRHDSSTYWSWREIDGRRCWYKGHSGKPKSQLYWPDDEDQPKKKRRMQDPIFSHHAEAKGEKDMFVNWNELNELDKQADIKPFLMFPPELTEKIDALLNFWSHRWDSK